MSHEFPQTQEQIGEAFNELATWLESDPVFGQGKNELLVRVNGASVTSFGNPREDMFMASTAKPYYLIAFFKLYFGSNEDRSLARLPLASVAEDIAEELVGHFSKGEPIDPLTRFLLGQITHDSVATKTKEALQQLIASMEISIADLIRLTCGDSSNTTVVLMRNLLAAKSTGGAVNEAVDKIETEYNNYADALGMPGTAQLNGSTAANDTRRKNAVHFDQQAAMFTHLYNNLSSNPEIFGLTADEANIMKEALMMIVPNPELTEQEFEIKVILKGHGFAVAEKSGYYPDLTYGDTDHWNYGFHSGLNWPDGFQGKDMTQISSFAQIILPSGEIIDVGYSLNVPFGEELPQDYKDWPTYVRLKFTEMLKATLTKALALKPLA